MAEDERQDEQAPEEQPEQTPEAAEEQPEEAPEVAEEQPEEAAEAPPEPPAAQKPSGKEKKEKKEEVVPGAELEPIQLEPERELDAEERARAEAEAEERARREAEATSEIVDEQVPAKAAQLEPGSRFFATGKRKSSIARVIIEPGDGKIEVNRRALEEYFPRESHQTMARQPLVGAGYAENVDVRARVHGGGIAGQAGAIRHGIARALTEADPELRPELKKRGFLTRDARVKERRKAGLKKARKRPQFSKR
jgi:small subunit ribosomal protein S9